MTTSDQDEIAVECLHPKAANWHCRPITGLASCLFCGNSIDPVLAIAEGRA